MCSWCSTYSAALCRGLIEASTLDIATLGALNCIPRLYAAASLKRRAAIRASRRRKVFRGFMPRPHGSEIASDEDFALFASVFRGFMPRPH